ncbi:MAG: hypothetical protein GWP10_19080 [Nitrospiraceae bacterium]|nr:hypothetical protein [Nitrospiraceae bacterium]
MKSSITFPTTFDPKSEKSAELIAYLTKGIAYRDNGDIRVAGKSKLNEIIAEKYEQKDFIGANEILEAARNISTEWTLFKLAERVSKSVRVPMSTYLKLVKYAAQNKLSLSDSIKKILSVPMTKQLDNIAGSQAVVNERIEPLYRSLDNWSTTKIILDGKIDLEKYRDYSRYSLHCDHNIDDRIYDLLKKPSESSVYGICEEKIPKKMIDRYMPYLKVDDLLMEDYIRFDDEKNELTLVISIEVLLGFEFEDYEAFKNEIISDFGVEAMKKFYNEFSIEEGYDVLCTSSSFDSYGISGIISVDADNKIYFENIEINEQNRDTLEAGIYKEITDEEYEDSDIYVDQVKDAIEKGDYDTAAKINEVLAMNQTYIKISSWLCDILFDSIKSKVVTFIIPPVLLGLLELAKGGERVSDLVDEYPEVV